MSFLDTGGPAIKIRKTRSDDKRCGVLGGSTIPRKINVDGGETRHIVKNVVKIKRHFRRKREKCLFLLVGAPGLEPGTR